MSHDDQQPAGTPVDEFVRTSNALADALMSDAPIDGPAVTERIREQSRSFEDAVDLAKASQLPRKELERLHEAGARALALAETRRAAMQKEIDKLRQAQTRVSRSQAEKAPARFISQRA